MNFADGLNKLLGVLDDELAHDLTDRELATLAAWTQHADPDYELPSEVQVMTNECKRRAQQGRTFAAYLEAPTLGEMLRRSLDKP